MKIAVRAIQTISFRAGLVVFSLIIISPLAFFVSVYYNLKKKYVAFAT